MSNFTQPFYQKDYDFIPDTSDIDDYDPNLNIQIPQSFNQSIYHSQNNISLLEKEPRYIANGPYPLPINFDVNKQLQIDYLLLEKLKKHSLMLTYQKSGIASAIYVQFKNKEYIFTAGHTFSSYSENDICIRINTADYPINKCRGIIWPPFNQDDYLVLDYCIIYVDKELSDNLKNNGYIPYNIGDDIPKYDHNGIYNFYYGFPASYNRFNVRSPNNKSTSLCVDLTFETKLLDFKNLKEINEIYKDIDFLDTNLSKCDHKELLYSTKDALIKKNAFKLPDLHGMSGCGVWRFIDYPFSCTNYVLEGMYLGANNSKNYTMLYFDKTCAILKYWDLVVAPLNKEHKEINRLIRF